MRSVQSSKKNLQSEFNSHRLNPPSVKIKSEVENKLEDYVTFPQRGFASKTEPRNVETYYGASSTIIKKEPQRNTFYNNRAIGRETSPNVLIFAPNKGIKTFNVRDSNNIIAASDDISRKKTSEFVSSINER